MNEQYTEMSVVDVLTVPKRKERLIKVLRIKGEPGIGNEFFSPGHSGKWRIVAFAGEPTSLKDFSQPITFGIINLEEGREVGPGMRLVQIPL